MSKKPACRVCGSTDVYWRQSAKGNWYLATTMNVSTSYGGNYAIPRAHSAVCGGPRKTIEEKRAELAAQIAQIDQGIAEARELAAAGVIELEEWKIACRLEDKEILRAELDQLG